MKYGFDPPNPLFPNLVKSVLRAPVPVYWILIMSAWSAHTFLKSSSNTAWSCTFMCSCSTPRRRRTACRLVLASMLWTTLVRSRQSIQLVLKTPDWRRRKAPSRSWRK